MNKKGKIITTLVCLTIILMAGIVSVILIGCTSKKEVLFSLKSKYNILEEKQEACISPYVYTNNKETELIDEDRIEKITLFSKPDNYREETKLIQEIGTDINNEFPNNDYLKIDGEQFYEIRYWLEIPVREKSFSLKELGLEIKTDKRTYEFSLGTLSVIYIEDNLEVIDETLLLINMFHGEIQSEYADIKDVFDSDDIRPYKEIATTVLLDINEAPIERHLVRENKAKYKDKEIAENKSRILSVDKVYTGLENNEPQLINYKFDKNTNGLYVEYDDKKSTTLVASAPLVIHFTANIVFTDGTSEKLSLISKTPHYLTTITESSFLTEVVDTIKLDCKITENA